METVSPEAAIKFDTSSMRPHDLAGRRLWPRVVRAVWFVAAALAVLIFVAALPAAVRAIEQGALLQTHQGTVVNNPDADPTQLDIIVTIIGVTVALIAVLVSLLLAFVIFWRRPEDRMAVFISFYLLWTGIVTNGPLELMEFYVPGVAIFTTDILVTFSSTVLSVTLLSLFPDGRFVPPWSRWLPLASITMLPLALFAYGRQGQFVTSPLIFVAVPIWATTAVLAFYAQVYRYRRVSSPDERQQTKWIIYGFGLWMFLSLLSAGPYFQMRNLEPGETLINWWVLFGQVAYFLSLTVVPIALTIAVLRYRLWDIDILINRTVVYSVLTAIIIVIYVLVVGSLGLLFHSGSNFIISLLATGAVAILFQPIRQRLQRRVNRMMFGERDEPYKVLERLSSRLDLVVQTEQILPTIVETVAQALKLPYVVITLRQGDGFKTGAVTFRSSDVGRKDDDAEIIPLVYQSEVVGQLILARRAQGEVFSQADRQLLDTIARQASIAAYNVRLTDELQRSREQLVTTLEEERRRLRRDLHDGLGPVLATITIGMDAIHNLADNPAATRDKAMNVKVQAQDALEDIRRIAYDLRLPMLDELGLVGALKQHIEAVNHVNSLHIVFDDPGTLPQLPAAVEVAVYRIALEAITNVQRHAQAQWCAVQLVAGQDLYLEICDNGCGLSQTIRSGVGLQTMRERAAELGGICTVRARPQGGTAVRVRLPLVVNELETEDKNP